MVLQCPSQSGRCVQVTPAAKPLNTHLILDGNFLAAQSFVDYHGPKHVSRAWSLGSSEDVQHPQQAQERYKFLCLKEGCKLGTEDVLRPTTERPLEKSIWRTVAKAGLAGELQDRTGLMKTDQWVGVICLQRGTKLEQWCWQLLPQQKELGQGWIWCYPTAAHLWDTALGLGVCPQAAFSNPVPTGSCVSTIVHNYFVFHKVPFNTGIWLYFRLVLLIVALPGEATTSSAIVNLFSHLGTLVLQT